MRVLVVAGARPNFMKVAPVIRALKQANIDVVLVHTGQHYDEGMSGAFFRDLDLPEPDHHMGVGSASHAVMTAKVMEAFEPILLAARPDWVIVVGDVNSTLACALVAVKLKEETGCRIAHIEAGLRSGDWRMPEEVNRILTDRLSDLLLTPSADAAENLLAEGLAPDRIAFAGNVMIDSLLEQIDQARALDMPKRFGLQRCAFVLVTLHRPSNVDGKQSLDAILEGLDAVAAEMPVVFPIHPRTRRSVEEHGLTYRLARLRVLEPLGYREMLGMVEAAAVVMTDSGGLQEETTVLGIPCVTLREQTERPITIAEGTNRLAGWPLSRVTMLEAFRAALATRREPRRPPPDGWDGQASRRIVAALQERALGTNPATGGGAPGRAATGEHGSSPPGDALEPS